MTQSGYPPIEDDWAFDKYEYVELPEPRRSPDTGMIYTHIAIPKKEVL